MSTNVLPISTHYEHLKVFAVECQVGRYLSKLIIYYTFSWYQREKTAFDKMPAVNPLRMRCSSHPQTLL